MCAFSRAKDYIFFAVWLWYTNIIENMNASYYVVNVCMFIYLSIYLSIYLHAYVNLSIYLYI